MKYVSYPFLVKPAIAHVAHFAPPFGCRVHLPYRFSVVDDEEDEEDEEDDFLETALEDDNFFGGGFAKGVVRRPDLVFTMSIWVRRCVLVGFL